MRVAGVVFASNLVCIIMMRRGEEWGGEERGGEDDYLACPHGFFEIGVARKCRTTTRALGVALGVVDRAAQQSENIQQKEKEVRRGEARRYKQKGKTYRLSSPCTNAHSRLSLVVGF